MSGDTKPVDAAFPTETANSYYHGMTLRDWFAGQALNGMLLKEEYAIDKAACSRIWAEAAYRHADAMLAAREVQS